MGFGIMIIGCIITVFGAFTSLSAFTYVVGVAIVLYSLKELIYQDKSFIFAMVISSLTLISSFAYMILFVLSERPDLIRLFLYITTIGSLVFFSLILIGIFSLARRVDLPFIEKTSILVLVIGVIYLVSFVLQRIVFAENESVSKVMNVISLTAQIMYSVLLVVVVFNSYMRICYEDDKDMEKKGSGFLSFLNDKLNRVMTPKEKREPNDKNKKGDK